MFLIFFFFSILFLLFCFVLFCFFLALAMALAGAVVSFRRGHVTFLFCVLFVVFYFKKRRIPSLAATDFVFFMEHVQVSSGFPRFDWLSPSLT